MNVVHPSTLRRAQFTHDARGAGSALRLRYARGVSLAAAVALISGCGNGEDTDTGDRLAPPTVGLTFTDAHNYSYSGTLEIDAIPVAPNVNGTIDWCALSTDLRGRAIADNTALDQVLIVSFQLSQPEVMTKVENNTLQQADSDLQFTLDPAGACSAEMADFAIFGNYFDPESTEVGLNVDPGTTWLASVANLPAGRMDILMSVFMTPTAGEPNSTVALTDTSTRLDYQADLHSSTKLAASVGEAGTFDWSAATVDVNGNELDPIRADQLLIGHIPVETIEEAEELFLRLDEEASELYTLDVYDETAADLGKARDAANNTFGGFTADGVWLVGIECTSCMSPAPLLLATVEVQ